VAALRALAMIAAVAAGSVMAQQRRQVTVKEMFALNHRLEIDAGTEVVWADPHFDRIWFVGARERVSGAQRPEWQRPSRSRERIMALSPLPGGTGRLTCIP
jgi:hypothetical protein